MLKHIKIALEYVYTILMLSLLPVGLVAAEYLEAQNSHIEYSIGITQCDIQSYYTDNRGTVITLKNGNVARGECYIAQMINQANYNHYMLALKLTKLKSGELIVELD